MTIEIINNGITDVTVVKADEGKDLWCNYLNCNYGKSVGLGFIYYDADNNELDVPYMLTVDDFCEVNEGYMGEENINNLM